MRLLLLVALILLPVMAFPQEAVLPWFTDAVIVNSSKQAKPADALPDAPGCYGNGVVLSRPCALSYSLLSKDKGMISFWIKPNWDGNDGLTHKILRIGDPESNGLLVEKSAQGMLRYQMAGGSKINASRYDVSNWKAGEWHHVAVVWMSNSSGIPIGLPLWIDKVCVNSTIFGGSSFMNPATMTDKSVYIGDESSDAIMDELVFRKYLTASFAPAQLDLIYRDYFRTAPYTAIEIDPEPELVPADRRVVVGGKKQFGLRAMLNGKWERVTDFAIRYGNWADFDAKPFITWTRGNTNILLSNTGLATGLAIGKCVISASFHGMSAGYTSEVISSSQPDLDVLFVERLPRYPKPQWPAEGETVQSVAHIGNFGYQTAPAGVVVKFEIIPDSNANFVLDPEEHSIDTRTTTISQTIAAGTSTTVSWSWNWTSNPVFIRVTVDPDNAISEICEANNQRCDLNKARAFMWYPDMQRFYTDYLNKTPTISGSFCDYDWSQAMTSRMNTMMREAVWDTTTPLGVPDALRIDNVIFGGQDHTGEYDAAWPGPESTVFNIDSAICHEHGHMIGLPDLYGHGTLTASMLITDNNYQKYAGSCLYPEIDSQGQAMWSSASWGHRDACGVGYSPLMVYCHMWLHPVNAGLLTYYAPERGVWPDLGRLVPSMENSLCVYDVYDQPLRNAAIYVYQIVHTSVEMMSRYYPDRAKFIGSTDQNGVFVFPKVTDPDWDDPNTDKVDGSISVWNPFGTVYSDIGVTPSYVSGDILMVKVVSGDQAEFHLLPLTEFTEAFFKGDHYTGVYPIRTGLLSAPGGTPVVRKPIPEYLRAKNLKPVAVAPSCISVLPGQTFTLDGSRSYDPEGQQLTYQWVRSSGDFGPTWSVSPVLTGTAPNNPYATDIYNLNVWDGVRVSDAASVYVIVASPCVISGKVIDKNNQIVPNAVVALKNERSATADAQYYAVTDANGNYTISAQTGYWYISAWKPGWMPAEDISLNITGDTPVDVQLTIPEGPNKALGCWAWATSSDTAGGSSVSNITDGSTSTSWFTVWNPNPKTQDIIIDLAIGGSRQTLGGIVLNWYGNRKAKAYLIDVMPAADPKVLNNWNNPANITRIYSAAGSTGGCTLDGQNYDPILLSDGISARGIRIRLLDYAGTWQYGIQEVKIYQGIWSTCAADVKNMSDGSPVQMKNMQITAVPGGGIPAYNCYVEDADHTGGIRVTYNSSMYFNYGAGDWVQISGTVRSSAGQKYIEANNFNYIGYGRLPEAVGMTNGTAAGSLAQGLLVKTWGKVKEAGSNYFTISDGSKKPLKVMCGALAKPAIDQSIRVRGIMSTDGTNPLLLMRNQQIEWTTADADQHALPFSGASAYNTRDYLLGVFEGGDLYTDHIAAATGGALNESIIRPSLGEHIGSMSWTRYDGKGDFVDFERIYSAAVAGAAYAHVYIYSPIQQYVDITVGAAGGLALWVNGTRVYRNDYIGGWYDADCVRNVLLSPGLNSVLIKTTSNQYGFGFDVGFTNPGSWGSVGGAKPKQGIGYLLNNQ